MAEQHQQRREIFWAQACVLEHADSVVLFFANCGAYTGRFDVSEVHQHAAVRLIRTPRRTGRRSIARSVTVRTVYSAPSPGTFRGSLRYRNIASQLEFLGVLLAGLVDVVTDAQLDLELTL